MTQFTLVIVLSIFIELSIYSYRFFVGEHTALYLTLNIFRNCYSIFAAAYVLMDKKMFFLPPLATGLPDDLFSLIFFFCVGIALSSIVFSIYRYLKLK